MKTLRLSLLVMTLLSAAMASAAVDPSHKDPATEPCQYQTIDACFHAGDWWYDTISVDDAGNSYETIDCGLSEGCKACGTTSLGKPVCVTVQMNASCKCWIKPVPNAGPNIVYCDFNGECQFRF